MRKINFLLTSKWNRMRSLSLLCVLAAFSHTALSTEVRSFKTGNLLGVPLGEDVEIVTEPDGASICEGSDATFYVEANNVETYQWQVSTDWGGSFSDVSNDGTHSNSTTSTLNITNASANMSSYLYRCVMTGTGQGATTSEVFLWVDARPSFYSHPESVEICEYESVSFSADADYADNYVWKKIAGANYYTADGTNGSQNTNQLYFDYASSGYWGDYYVCIASNFCGSDTSNAALLRVLQPDLYYLDNDGDGYVDPSSGVNACEPPDGYVHYSGDDCDDNNSNVYEAASIDMDPEDVTICADQIASFEVAAWSSDGFQWQVNNGSGFQNLTGDSQYIGVNSNILYITSVTEDLNTYEYRCIAYSPCGNATSASATLTVNHSPVISLQPQHTSTCEYSPVSISVQETGTDSYQWEMDNGSGYSALSDDFDYAGTNSASLQILNPTVSLSGSIYRCILTSTYCGFVPTDPAVLTVLANTVYYEDADNDGYGNGAATFMSCAGAPGGYVSNPYDCNDGEPDIYPGAMEICGDGVDNNCDGNIDEGCTTQLVSWLCSTTLSAIDSDIEADAFPGAVEYRFRIINGADVQTIDKVSPQFDMIELPSYAYSTTYTIDVAVDLGSGYGAYGSACDITTPSSITQVQAIQCGTNLPSISTPVFADEIIGATQYRFRVTNGANVQTIDRPIRHFNLTQLTTYGYGMTYTVDVSAEVDGVFGPYGSACNVTMLALKTKIQASQCGSTVANFATPVYANSVSGATQYRFRITNGVNVQTIDKTVRSFSFNELVSYDYATTYTVDIAIEMYGSGSFDPYGVACTITTPAAPLTQVEAAQCGTTLASLSTTINAINVVDATQYRFRVTNGANVQTIDKMTRSFNLTELTTYNYATVYTIDVAVKTGTWGSYGPSCNVTTPGTSTKVRASQCGVALTSLSTNILADNVSDATQYRFRITNGANVQTIDRAVNSFNLTQLPSYAYGTTYSIDVAVERGGVFEAYGSVCNVTTPTLTTKVKAAQCGTTLAGIATVISANNISGATQYRFRVVNGANVQTIDRAVPSFTLTQLPSYDYATTYSIDVAIEMNNSGSFGAYGTACNVSTPAMPTTQVEAVQCASTLATMSTLINADAVSGATQYRFRITNGANVQTIDRTTRSFSLNQLASYAYSTTYTIDVAVMVTGTWFPYGSACNVTTPGLPTTQVRASQCGVTLTSISTSILADNIAGATQYRFRVTEGANVQTIDKATNSFALNQLANYAYGTTYTVDVAFELNGSFGAYGSACTVSTPKLTTKVRTAQCGTTLATIGTLVSANSVAGATQYRFRVTNGASVQTIDRPVLSFQLTQLATYEYATTYSIDVAVETNGTFGPYGGVCNITTPANTGARGTGEVTELKSLEAAEVAFDAVTFPNPFSNEFGVSVSTERNEMISVTVYDMTGKVLSANTVSPQEIGNLRLGADFASGIYQVQVVQGTEAKTVKIVKG